MPDDNYQGLQLLESPETVKAADLIYKVTFYQQLVKIFFFLDIRGARMRRKLRSNTFHAMMTGSGARWGTDLTSQTRFTLEQIFPDS